MSIKLKDTANITATSASSATSATKLQTARTINGTSFDGSANITTANWGTARTLTIGNTGKSVNGSGNVSWSLSEIGAAAASHGRHIPDVCETITDWNNATKNGWYMGNNATNSPTANAWYFGEVIAHNTNYVFQTVYQFNVSSDAKGIPKYIRAKMNGAWGAWTNVTVAKAVPPNAVFTDTNTWRGVQDNLTSTATDQSLSANQGKVLKGLIDGKAASNHTHSYVPLSNGGNITIHADSDSSSTGEYALIKAGHNELKIASSAGGTTVTKGQDKLTFNGNIVYHAGRKPTISEIGAAASNHTHNYLPLSGGTLTGSLKISGNNKNLVIGAGTSDVYINNTASGKYIQMKDDGLLSYSGNKIYHAGDKPTASEVGALATSGGTLTGSIKFSGGGYNNHAIRMEAGDANGAFIGIGAGGLTVIGSGESTNAVRTALTNGADETMIVASDQTIRFLTGVQNGYSSAKEVSINAAGVINAPQGMTGNASTATKLQTARTINGTNFDGTGNITTANWGTARNLNGVSVNGSTNYTIPVENYYCNVGNDNTNLYHRILTTDIATANFVDKSLIIVMHSGYQGGGFGIAKITLRTNDISSAANSQGEIKWLVRNGFAANALVFNFVNQAKNACMDVFYKSPGTYAGMTWYVLSEGGRGGAHSKQWTKYNTNASGTNAYTEANMKTLRTYTSTLVSATDAGHVSTANSANTLTTARTINGTSFNGSGNITTANWGTARNLQIGNTAKSVNGSANVTWTLGDIGAAAANHTHGLVNLNSEAFSGGNDLNTYNSTKTWIARTLNSTTNKPADYFTVVNFGASANSNFQLAHSYANSSTLYVRGRHDKSGNYTPWAKIYTDKNKPTASDIGAAPSSSTSLKTTDKTIVGAINEVFQSGNSVKQNLVDTLIAKGAENISTSNSWDSLIDMIEGSNINLAPIGFNVEQIPNAQYGFRPLDSGPYYESENFGVHNSYAMCKLNIVCNSNYNVYLDCINYTENNYDYGIISLINTPLTFSYQADTTGVLKSFKGLGSPEVQTVQLKSESGFYYIKYIKDSSASQGNDSFRFKVRFEKKTGGNPGGNPDNPGGEGTILFSSTIGGDNRSLTGGYTHLRQDSDSYLIYDASCIDFCAQSDTRGDTLETVISENRIELTNYSRLRIKAYVTTSTNDSGGAPLVGFDALGTHDEGFAASTIITSSAQRYYDLDISGLTGYYHLKFNVATSMTNPGTIIKHLYITELILYP